MTNYIYAEETGAWDGTKWDSKKVTKRYLAQTDDDNMVPDLVSRYSRI